MASIAQAVSTAASVPATSTGSDAAAPQSTAANQDSAPMRQQDTVNLTETGSRNRPARSSAKNQSEEFQLAYFPPKSSPDAQVHHSVARYGPASAMQNTNPGDQMAITARSAASSSMSSGTSSGSPASASQTANLSAASQAKLQQLNQVLQRLGINPDQISFSARIALLPLVNDPAAIEQYVQGLPTKTAVLNPATSQAVAATAATQAFNSNASARSTLVSIGPAPSAVASNGAPASSNSAQVTLVPIAPGVQPSSTIGHKVNISV